MKTNLDFVKKEENVRIYKLVKKGIKKDFQQLPNSFERQPKGFSRSIELATFLPESSIVHEPWNSRTLGLIVRVQPVLVTLPSTGFISEFHELELWDLSSKLQASTNLKSKFDSSIVHELSNLNPTTRVQSSSWTQTLNSEFKSSIEPLTFGTTLPPFFNQTTVHHCWSRYWQTRQGPTLFAIAVYTSCHTPFATTGRTICWHC